MIIQLGDNVSQFEHNCLIQIHGNLCCKQRCAFARFFFTTVFNKLMFKQHFEFKCGTAIADNMIHSLSKAGRPPFAEGASVSESKVLLRRLDRSEGVVNPWRISDKVKSMLTPYQSSFL